MTLMQRDNQQNFRVRQHMVDTFEDEVSSSFSLDDTASPIIIGTSMMSSMARPVTGMLRKFEEDGRTLRQKNQQVHQRKSKENITQEKIKDKRRRTKTPNSAAVKRQLSLRSLLAQLEKEGRDLEQKS